MIFKLKRETLLYRALMYSGCGVILFFYFAGVYFWKSRFSGCGRVYDGAEFSAVLTLSRHKGSRFLLTFCFVDTVSLIVAFIGRYMGILFQGGSVWTFW